MEYHIPVLSKEVLNILQPRIGKTFIDATLGNGGHTSLLLQEGAEVFGIDQDPSNLKIASDRIEKLNHSSSFTGILGNFSEIKKLTKEYIHKPIDGILLDLGLSSNQQKAFDRGFSFNDPKSLDMRLNPENKDQVTAEFIINTASYDELYEIFSKLAQEKYSKTLILKIIRERQKSPIKSGSRLAEIIRSYYQEKHIRSSIDPATKIFMALRIAINSEFSNLKSVLNDSLEIVKPGGIVAVISFHSGEDRIVKQFIKTNPSKIDNLTPKAVLPSNQEIKDNPLSRSATLRSYRIK